MPLSQYLDKKAGKRSCRAGCIIRNKTVMHTSKIYMISKADTTGWEFLVSTKQEIKKLFKSSGSAKRIDKIHKHSNHYNRFN